MSHLQKSFTGTEFPRNTIRIANVFIVGVQKAGTTALHSFLAQHPQIQMSEQKELHFFDNDNRNWTDPDYADFERRFSAEKSKIRGESTPIYIYWPNSLERLKIYDPAAKLIVLLRHPTFRAYSHWKMEMLRNAETLSFEEAVSATGRERVRSASGGVHRVFSYIERGFYARQVSRLLTLFPREQVHFALTDDLWLTPRETLSEIETFLHVDHFLSPEREYIVLANTKFHSELDNRIRWQLDALYAPDIRETAAITGLNLSGWLDPDYVEPTKDR
ncbi:sulfotransferase family protein [Phyllobacterium phragmitis]|uniref:Sulfotransferase n=1 Tax=Phyllobacterium phragmitis TaxID=2670329 RepID=A0ABQ0GX30_9HYPH